MKTEPQVKPQTGAPPVGSSALFVLPVLESPEILYLPRRALAFGQADFRYWKGQPIGRHTFFVLGWADSERRQCAKKEAAYAIIRCAWKALLPLRPNDRTELSARVTPTAHNNHKI